MAIKVAELSAIHELTAAERMNLKTMSDFQDIKNMVGMEMTVSNMATLTCCMDESIDRKTGEVHPPKEYNRYVCISPDGEMYVTSSETFRSDVEAFLEELNEGQSVVIKIVSMPSKNNDGDFFKAKVLDIV